MTDYVILSLVITLIGLLVGVVSLLLKAFEYLDSRYRKNEKPHPKEWPF